MASILGSSAKEQAGVVHDRTDSQGVWHEVEYAKTLVTIIEAQCPRSCDVAAGADGANARHGSRSQDIVRSLCVRVRSKELEN